MSQAINTAVINTLKAAASFQQRVADLRGQLSRATLADRDALIVALRPGVAKFYGIEHAEHGATGKFVCDDDKVSMAARTALSKLVRAVQGPVAHETVVAKVRVKATEKDAYNAFLAACGGDVKRMAAVIKALKA
jgi:hypothetical protein